MARQLPPAHPASVAEHEQLAAALNRAESALVELLDCEHLYSIDDANAVDDLCRRLDTMRETAHQWLQKTHPNAAANAHIYYPTVTL